jgi:chromosomal replication initiator protein
MLGESQIAQCPQVGDSFTRLASCPSLTRAAINIEAIEHMLHNLFHEEASAQMSIEHIQRNVAEDYRLKSSDMVGRRRPVNIAFLRQVAIYGCRVRTPESLSDIARKFCERGHETVIHVCKTVENMIDQDTSIQRRVECSQKLVANSK